MPFSDEFHVSEHECRGHHHSDDDRKAISRFHMFRFPEIKHHTNATDPKRGIHTRYINLPFDCGRKFNLNLWPQIHTDRFADQCKGSADQGLTGNYRGKGGNYNSSEQKPVRHQFIEWIESI